MHVLSTRDHVPGQRHSISLRDLIDEENASSLRDALVCRHPNAVVWQGFDHEWGYNHRANRLGSYVRPEDEGIGLDTWEVAHTAASGSGPDTADVTDYYAMLKAGGLWVTTATAELTFEGPDTEPIVEHATATATLPEPMENREEYVALLNGFDLVSDGDADKLIEFDLEIDGQPTDVQGDTVDVDLKSRITGSCSTPECNDDETTFTLYAYVLVLGGDAGLVQFSDAGTASNAYSWPTGNADDEIHASDRGYTNVTADRSARLDGEDGRATLGFTGFSIAIEKTGGHPALSAGEAVHLLQLALAIRNLSQDADSVSADVLLFFKNWEQGMKGAHPPESQGSLKDAGNVAIEASLATIEVAEELGYREDSRSTSITWNADAPSHSDDARDRTTVRVED